MQSTQGAAASGLPRLVALLLLAAAHGLVGGFSLGSRSRCLGRRAARCRAGATQHSYVRPGRGRHRKQKAVWLYALHGRSSLWMMHGLIHRLAVLVGQRYELDDFGTFRIHGSMRCRLDMYTMQ